MDTGWIKIHRKILDNPIATKPHWAWLWVVILLRANHASRSFFSKGELIACKPGQFVAGRDELALQARLSPSSVERALEYFERSGQIEQQKNSKGRLITIIKWEEYQSGEQQKNNWRTTGGQLADTNKNVKNDKNEKKEEDSPAEIAKDFFEKGASYYNVRDYLIQKIPEGLVDEELTRFFLYWTEPNGSGTRQRWQQQKTFEIRRRIATWFNKVKNYQVREVNRGRGIA